MNLDLRSIAHANHLMLVVVRLHNLAAFERNLLEHQLAQAIDDGSLDLGLGAARIDDLAADIPAGPHLMNLQTVLVAHANFCHMSEIALKAIVKRDAHAGSCREL